MARNTLIQVRRDTAANWTSANPTLAAGEVGFETNTGLFKIGDGSTSWSSLAYAAVTATGTATLTNKTIALGSNTVSGSIAQFNSAVTDADLATLAGSETLTNKTISLANNTVSGSTSQFNSALTDGDFATLAGTETLTNKTLTSAEETWTVTATAASGTVNLDIVTASSYYFTSNAAANWTFNFRGNSSTTLSSILAVGSSVTVAFAATNGSTAYRPTGFQIDGSTVTPKWQGGVAPSTGSTNSIDLYLFTIVKTASSPSYTIFASQTKFV